MKKVIVYSFIVMFLACAGKQELSPSDTAKIVAESFYHGDRSTLKEYTTASGYTNLSGIQDMFTEDKDSESNFKVEDEKTEDDIVWVKYSTSYDPKPGIFKLVKENGKWKVTQNGPREKSPF